MFFWNIAAVACIASTFETCGLASRLPDNADVIDNSDVIYSIDLDKSNSISQLINDKSRNLQKFTEIF